MVNGLNHSTKYEFYVRAKCGNTDHSTWSDVATATTQCGTWQYADMPLTEDFDDYTGYSYSTTTASSHSLPRCWDYINAGTTGNMNMPTLCNTSNYRVTGNSLMFYNTTATTNGEQYAILPEGGFGFDLDTLEVSFAARTYSGTASYVVLGVMSDKDDASTFVSVDTVHLTATFTDYQVSFKDYNGNGSYIAFKAPKIGTTNRFFIDNLTIKLREKVNMLADNGETIAACNEFVLPDTTNGGYHGNLNTTYVVRPAEAGKVAHLTGSYNLENGYDFLNVYRGAANANNLIGRYTGDGNINEVTSSNLWADSGYFTLVLTTDNDNAFNDMYGFKLLVSCECPQPAADIINEVVEENGTYTWRNGQTYTNNIVRTGLTYDANATAIPDADLTRTADYTYTNVAGCDSVSYSLNLTVHPTYNLTYNAQICERDTFAFYGNEYTTTGTYTVALTSQYGADSTGILSLQVNPAPLAYIYSNNRQVSTIDAYCDGVDLALEARSNNSSATFEWEDESTATVSSIRTRATPIR